METSSPANSLTVSLAKDLYELEAVKLAAYRFANEAAATLEPSGDRLVCTFTPLSENGDMASLEGRFRNEVIDQDLRRRIARETETTRNLILAMAFSKTGLSG